MWLMMLFDWYGHDAYNMRAVSDLQILHEWGGPFIPTGIISSSSSSVARELHLFLEVAATAGQGRSQRSYSSEQLAYGNGHI
jgi:hypothetical protein